MTFAAATDATKVMATQLKPYGVIVEQVILGDFSFKPDYQNLINKRKEAEKQAEKLESQILATLESNKANLQSKVADLTEQLTHSQGDFEQAKRAADAYVVPKQQDAHPTLPDKNPAAHCSNKQPPPLQ